MFRKIIAAAASVIMLTACTSFTAFAADEEKVVAVCTAADLYDITADTDKVYLRADIDLSGYDWDGIKEFSGVFYGNGNSIRNMKSDSCGLFYSLGTGAKIKDVRIENAEIISDEKMLGGIVSYIPSAAKNVEITDCHVSGIIHTSYDNPKSSLNFCGGIVGVARPESTVIKNCASSAVVEAVFGSGGIAGLNHGSVESCVFTGRVNCSNNNHHYCNCPERDDDIHLEFLYTGKVLGGIAAVNYGSVSECVSLVSRCEDADYSGLICGVNIRKKGILSDNRAVKLLDNTSDIDYHFSNEANTITEKNFMKLIKTRTA